VIDDYRAMAESSLTERGTKELQGNHESEVRHPEPNPDFRREKQFYARLWNSLNDKNAL
jgi:hypothetical protein